MNSRMYRITIRLASIALLTGSLHGCADLSLEKVLNVLANRPPAENTQDRSQPMRSEVPDRHGYRAGASSHSGYRTRASASSDRNDRRGTPVSQRKRADRDER